MPKINTNVINEIDIEENQEYVIKKVETFVSKDKQQGLKVSLVSTDEANKQKYSTILWTRKDTGIKSKLGAFVGALTPIDKEGNFKEINTDDWIGVQIRVLSWKEKDRKIIAV